MSEIVNKLFGVTTDSYQRAQQDSADAQALQYAKLDPIEKASYGAGRAGYALGGAIGGALGGKDPELQRITRRQQIAGQINYNDDASILKAMDELRDDAPAMMQLQEILVSQRAKRAAIGKDEALTRQADAASKRDKAPPTTNEITNARAIALRAGEEGSPEYITAFNETMDRLTAKDIKDPRFGTDRESIAMADHGKPFALLTQAQQTAVNNKFEENKGSVSAKGAARTMVDVNAFVPANVEAQKQFIQIATKEREALRNAPDTLTNIEAAKKLIPTASTFMGKGGEPLLAAASFLNNRLGLSISTKGVTDATVLRTRLFEGILDNLKKLDSQPSQEQQRVLSEALGNLGTDPLALEKILDRIGETVTSRVNRYNTDVTEAEGRGIKFPFKPQITLPLAKQKPADAAAQIPTATSATTIPQSAIDALKSGAGTDAQFDQIFGAGAAKRVKGVK